jgi:hypothetical protein
MKPHEIARTHYSRRMVPSQVLLEALSADLVDLVGREWAEELLRQMQSYVAAVN